MQFINALQNIAQNLFPEMPKGAENINHCAFASCLSENWYAQLESKEDFQSCNNADKNLHEYVN